MQKKAGFKIGFHSFGARVRVLMVVIMAMAQLLVIAVTSALPKSYLWWAWPLCLLGGGAWALYLAREVTHSLGQGIKRLVAIVHAVERGEKLEGIAMSGHEELEEVAQAINRLADRDTKAVKEVNQDPLTKLVNRRYLMEAMTALLAEKKPISLMFIDLDGFKPINDEFGHDVGDEALKTAADRMTGCLRERDVLARLGGDEFVILFNGLTDKNLLSERGNKLLEVVGTPMWLAGNRVRMGASIGISIAPDDASDAEGLLNAADQAMYAAKHGGKNAFRFYS